jgi:pseudouridine-5'-phosphate glycosidase
LTAVRPSAGAVAVAVGSAVASALADGRPVVALESAIITHGLPRPRNLEVAEQLEDLLRTQAVVPATVGVIGGVATVGLSAAELKELACADGAAKVSVRDLPVVMARRASGGTTVAATAWLAHHVGIRVFATGGIGGVHRGAGHTFDESADLPTLAHTPITVVCAGVKSILDVPATLERLETLGVTVVGFQTRSFPGFYVTDSGAEIEVSVTGPDEVVAMMGAARALALPGALVVANPVPVAEQLDPEVHDTVIALALASAAAEGIRGPAITPYLLDRLYQATGGASLAANLAAVRNNVTVAGRIALAWSAHG